MHDEVISEVDVTRGGSVEEYEALLQQVPTWAEGLPVKAEGWTGLRYRK